MKKRGIGIKILQGMLAILILLAAIAATVWLIKTKPAPRKQKPPKLELLVETTVASPSSNSVVIEAMGTARAHQQVSVNPEVAGLVVWKNPNLIAGGLIEKGGPLIRIDDRNYAAAVRQAEAQLQQVQVEYELELSRRAVAAEEWGMLESGADVDRRAKSLALRKPQLRAAEASLKAASNALDRARLDMERCEIASPFNAVVLEENVDLGQLVGSQTSVARLAGTDRFEIMASLPVYQLDHMEWPDENGAGGASATIEYDRGAGEMVHATGRVVRLLGDLGNPGRLARVLIAVDDPLKIDGGEASDRLYIGSYLRCLIQGHPMPDSFRIPSELLREGDKLWIMDDDSKLDIRPVEVLWRQSGHVLIGGGLQEGERIVSSHISVPLPGAALREADAEEPGRPKTVDQGGGE